MPPSTASIRLRRKTFSAAALFALCFVSAFSGFAGTSTPLLLTPKWGRFEQAFKSSAMYANPPLEATLMVQFISPLGETNEASAFWDGGPIWRVRFAPDQPGKWTFRTTCSDATNAGLNHVSGEFLCTAASGRTQFDRHGPIRVARDHRHLEHHDQTPLLWMADAAWEGALRSKLKDWNDYAQVRAGQKFNVVQWIATPGTNSRNQSAFSDDQHLLINPDFFKELDIKVEILDRAGILSAIAPIWDVASRGQNDFASLTDEQAVMLLRYMVARWSASNVAWILTCEGDSAGGKAQRWKRIGRQVFGGNPHAPVVLFPGSTYWTLDEFRNEPWVDVLSYQSGPETTDDSLQYLLAGPISTDWRRSPPHPMLNLSVACESQAEGLPEDLAVTRAMHRAVCWSLLNSPTAGASYSAAGVWDWRDPAPKNAGPPLPFHPPTWEKGELFPAARHITNIVEFFSSIEFWQLRPAPELVANQPGLKSPGRFIAAARSLNPDMAVVYVPDDPVADLNPAALPESPKAVWINPATGERTTATASVSGASCRYATPGPGDWLLWIKAGK